MLMSETALSTFYFSLLLHIMSIWFDHSETQTHGPHPQVLSVTGKPQVLGFLCVCLFVFVDMTASNAKKNRQLGQLDGPLQVSASFFHPNQMIRQNLFVFFLSCLFIGCCSVPAVHKPSYCRVSLNFLFSFMYWCLK